MLCRQHTALLCCSGRALQKGSTHSSQYSIAELCVLCAQQMAVKGLILGEDQADFMREGSFAEGVLLIMPRKAPWLGGLVTAPGHGVVLRAPRDFLWGGGEGARDQRCPQQPGRGTMHLLRQMVKHRGACFASLCSLG